VTGHEDWAVDATEVRSNIYEAVYCEASGTIPGGDYWVMIANSGTGTGQLTDIELGYNDSAPVSPCRGSDADAGDSEPDVVEDVPEDAPAEADATPTGCDPTQCTNDCQSLGQSGGRCLGEGAEAYCACTSDSGGCGCRAAGGHGRAAWIGLLFVGFALASRRRSRP
jgi:MYXO-CTERM domain-containing protein